MPNHAAMFHATEVIDLEHARAIEANHSIVTPKSRPQALKIDKERGNNNWERSMTKEHKQLESRGTWRLVPMRSVPKGRKLIPSVW